VSTAGAREVRLQWRRGANEIIDEVVAPVLAAGPTQGTALAPAGGTSDEPVIRIAWAESDDTIHVAERRFPLIGPQPPWTVTRNVASGRQPTLHGAILAYADDAGLHLRRYSAGSWGAPTSVAAEVTSYGLRQFDDGFDNVRFVWRTPAQDVRTALSRNLQPFVISDIETGVAANPVGAAVAGNVEPVYYTRDDGTSVMATLHLVEGWRKRTFGRYPGQGRNITTATHYADVAYTSSFGVHTASLYRVNSNGAPRVTEQVVSTRCSGGQLAGSSLGVVLPYLVHTCEDGRIYSLLGSTFDDLYDWHQRCLAVARTLAARARSCAPAGTACVIEGGLRLCASGDAVDEMAYAQLCTADVVDPATIDACEAAAATVACVAGGGDGTVTMPAACLP
jgi:hypothetical protein